VTGSDLAPYLSAMTAIPGTLSRRVRRQEASAK